VACLEVLVVTQVYEAQGLNVVQRFSDTASGEVGISARLVASGVMPLLSASRNVLGWRNDAPSDQRPPLRTAAAAVLWRSI